MPNIEFLSLDVRGHANAAVPNRFLKQTGASRALAVILPGLNYSCDAPLLHYTTNLLLDHSADVLQLWVNYTIPAFQALSKADQLKWLVDDASALIAAGQMQRRYGHLILAGKSIGTLTLGALFGQSHPPMATSIWFTPLIRYPFVVEGALRAGRKALFLAGSADATFDPDALARIQASTAAQSLVIADANHSLEIPGHLPRSLDAMQQILQAIETLIASEK